MEDLIEGSGHYNRSQGLYYMGWSAKHLPASDTSDRFRLTSIATWVGTTTLESPTPSYLKSALLCIASSHWLPTSLRT